LGSSSSRVPAPGEMGVVMKEKLQEVLGRDRWRINNYLDKNYKPQQIYAIVKQACGLIGARLPYSLVRSNCEHFATDLRYGKPTSRQLICVFLKAPCLPLQVINAGAGVGGTLAAIVLFTGTAVGILLGRR
ncbi:hypothetical protein GOODEAATRI_031839, partial [Goodea atripinnis]